MLFLISIGVSGFFIFHLKLICYNVTTLEYTEKKEKSKYDNGIVENLK